MHAGDSRRIHFYTGGSQGIYKMRIIQIGRDMLCNRRKIWNQQFRCTHGTKRRDGKSRIKRRTEEIRGVTSVISYVNSVGAMILQFCSEDEISRLHSEHYSRFIVSVKQQRPMASSRMLSPGLRDRAENITVIRHYLREIWQVQRT